VNGRTTITENIAELDAETKDSTRKTEENWMKGIKKAKN
jgi:hypothetical protein